MSTSALEMGLAGALAQVEQAVDDQLNYLDALGDDDIEKIRKKRMGDMKRAAEKKREWSFMGHGVLTHTTEKDFFESARKSDRVVVCFYRPGSSQYADDLISHLDRIASTHMETKFVVLNAEKSPFLTDRLKIWCLPSIALVRKGRTDKTFHGLSEISPKGKLDTVAIEQILFDSGILTTTALGDELAGHNDSDEDLH